MGNFVNFRKIKMKYTLMVIFGVIASTQAVSLRYDESEGPTQADNGEDDDSVLHAAPIDQNKNFKWENPLLIRDDGTGDDTVISQMRSETMGMNFNMNKMKHRLHSKKKPIWDVDGDGIEDIRELSREQLDSYYHPAVQGVVEDLYNTRHGNMPGHNRRAEQYDEPVFHDPWGSFVQKKSTHRHHHHHQH